MHTTNTSYDNYASTMIPEYHFQQHYQNEYVERYPSEINRPMTYFEISIDGVYAGRIVFELFTDVVPKTCENFRQYCVCTQYLNTYLNTPFHRIVPGKYICGGDITNFDGRGGNSIYGGNFDDENFKAKHKIEGLLTMANKGPNTNNSQFMITLFPLPWLDGKHVVFGRVIKGYEVCRKIEAVGSELGKPRKNVIISKCGQIDKRIGVTLP